MRNEVFSPVDIARGRRSQYNVRYDFWKRRFAATCPEIGSNVRSRMSHILAIDGYGSDQDLKRLPDVGLCVARWSGVGVKQVRLLRMYFQRIY